MMLHSKNGKLERSQRLDGPRSARETRLEAWEFYHRLEEICISFLFQKSPQHCPKVSSCLLLSGNLPGKHLVLQEQPPQRRATAVTLEKGRGDRGKGKAAPGR